MMLSLREKQVQALGKMISIERDSPLNDNFADQWKVLIYDEDCRDIISPLLNVTALRQKGVTLHLLLHSEREPITDAPAAYFIRPTDDNLKKIAEDCGKRLYRSFYVHFVTKIERHQLENFAKDIVTHNAVSLISKIYDQYLDIIALEPNLFTLNIKNSFIAFNDPSLSEVQIKSFISRMTYGLMSMIRLLGAVPIIRASSGGPAEMLAQELCTTLREQLYSRNNSSNNTLFTDCLTTMDARNRPLLILFDRTLDMSPPLIHTSTYQALIDDVLEHHLNRVIISPPKTSTTTPNTNKKLNYDLNTVVDTFYSNYHHAPLPEAVEANMKDLEEVTKIEAELRSHPSSNGGYGEHNGGGDSSSSSSSGGGKQLSDVIETLPEVLARKKTAETHTNILGAIMTQIKARSVPAYFELEQTLISAGRITDKPATLALLKDGTKGLLLDKARLLSLITIIIYMDASSTTSGGGGGGVGGSAMNSSGLKAVLEEYDIAFTQGCQAMSSPPTQDHINKVLAAMVFLRRNLSLQNNAIQYGYSGSNMTGNNSVTAMGLQSFLNTAQTKLKSAVDKAASFFAKFATMYITKVVESLAESRNGPEEELFQFMDPKSRPGEPVTNSQAIKYSDVIVFAIGGGCYAEYNNLQEWLKMKQSTNATTIKNIVYGCTELTSGDKFFGQLESLGSP